MWSGYHATLSLTASSRSLTAVVLRYQELRAM
jgi:hypothetical protein